MAGPTPDTTAFTLAGSGLPEAPGTQAVRQRAMLQMQRRLGNEAVQRVLAQQVNRAPIHRPAPIQRQDEEIPELSEAEKAAALAAAAAAEATAAQSASEGQQEAAKSQAEKSVEKEKGQVANQKVAQEAGAAKNLGEKAKNAEAKAKGVDQKGGAAKKPGANGAAPVGKEVKGGAAAKAPASPEEDPGFQQVAAKAKAVAGQEKQHEPAEKRAGEAQAAAESPAAEIEARAQDKQVGEMEQVESPAFNAAAFKAQLMQRIQALAPTTAKEADEFKQGNKLGGLKDGMKGQVSAEKEASQQPMAEKAAAAPDAGSVEPKSVTPLEPADTGPLPEKMGAEAAAPKPKTGAEVEQPLQSETKKIDQEMAEADVTEEQLKKSNEPQFQGALEAKQEAKSHAVEAPQQYRQDEAGQLAGAQADAETTAGERTQAMHDERAGLLAQVTGEQTQTKSKDEQKRAEIGAHIQGVYEQTKTKVDKLLGDLDGEVERVFDAGAEAAKKAFEDYVDAKMKAYKQRRYGGWLGWARWARDKIAGMPGEVNAFYAQGRQLYINKMDAVIDNVVAVVGRALTQAKAEIAAGKKAIQEYVAGLPENLQGIGQEAAQNIQGKFEELEQSVDSKQDELIDSLAQKYNENLQAIDARIEELKAANRGLIDKAIGAVKGVIETIKQLKDLLLGALAAAADAIGKILKDPIGFLGNLISGIKQGLQNFVSNIGAHLKKGLMGWLFGELAKSGIQLPETFDLKGILTLVMQVLGLTWENLRARAVKLFGEKVVAALEKGFEIFTIVKEKGIGGLWEFVKDKLSSLKDTVIEGIKEMVITQVIKAGITWLIGILGGPAGAFIKAAKAIYDIVMWFINNAAQLASLIQAIVGAVSAIAGGSLGAAAKYIEDTLARFIPMVIGFLASLLGLGNLGQKIRGIIQKVQEPINKAIDWVLAKARAAAKKLVKMLGIGKDKESADGAQVKAKARQRVAEKTRQPFSDPQALTKVVSSIEDELKPEGLKSLKAQPQPNNPGKYDIIATASPSEDVGDAEVQGGTEIPFTEGESVKVKFAGEKKRFSSSTVTKIDKQAKLVWFTRAKDQAKRGIPFDRLKELENVEWTKGEGEHSAFLPKILDVQYQNEERIVTFEYEDDDQQKKFTVKQRLSDYLTTSVKGINLSLKPFAGRGVTEEASTHVRSKGMHSAHLVADWFGGCGYKQSLNLISTSDHFNTSVMGGVERTIVARFQSLGAAQFDMQVDVEWGEFLDGNADQATEEQIKARVTSEVQAGERGSRAQRIQDFVRQARSTKRKAKRCEKVTYKISFKDNSGKAIGDLVQAIGPDKWIVA
jgi:hypothetical protein